MNANDRWALFLYVAGILFCSAVLGVRWLRRNGWRALLFTSAYQPRHVDLPRSRAQAAGKPGSTRSTGHGPGQPGWDEPDDDYGGFWRDDDDEDRRCISCGAEIDHYAGCPDDPDPEWPDTDPADTLEQTAVIDYDQPPPPRFIPAVPATDGSWIGLAGTITPDLPRPAPAQRGVMPEAGNVSDRPGQPYPHAGPPAWHPAAPQPRIPCRDPEWCWIGGAWVRLGTAGVPWLDALFTAPLRQLEAA